VDETDDNRKYETNIVKKIGFASVTSMAWQGDISYRIAPKVIVGELVSWSRD
jgi:hypothetical protein